MRKLNWESKALARPLADILVCAGVLLVGACSSSASAPPAAPAASAKAAADDLAKVNAVAVVTAWAAAFEARDYDKLVALYADNATTTPASSGMVLTGGEAIASKFYKPFYDSFPDMAMDRVLTLQRGKTIATIVRARGTNSAPMMGRPATNKPVSWYGLQVLELDQSGKIAKEMLYADNLNFMGQLGIYPGIHRPYDEGKAPPLMTATAAASSAEEANVAVVRKSFESFNAHDLEAAVALYTPDAIVRNQSAPMDIQSREAVKAAMAMYFGWFSDVRVEAQSMWSAGEYVVATYVIAGTNDGELTGMGKPATNRSIRLEGGDVYRIVDGQIAEHWIFLDGMVMMMQLGMLQL